MYARLHMTLECLRPLGEIIFSIGEPEPDIS